jgi:hypothetical protein
MLGEIHLCFVNYVHVCAGDYIIHTFKCKMHTTYTAVQL